jgi:DNA invertase Pin-like site-specific DNA recombinase
MTSPRSIDHAGQIHPPRPRRHLLPRLDGHQTTENQERELHAIADRMGWTVVKVYRDQGVGGAKSRENRPAFDALCKDASRRQFDLIAAWSVDRLGRSLQDFVGFLTEVHALGINLFLHQQGIGGR